MNWKILTGITIFLAIMIIGGIFLFREEKISTPEPKPEFEEKISVAEPKQKLADINNVVDANNQFALDYYSKLKEKDSDNIFFSPFSISTALAMTYEGARGQTAEEMRRVFYFPRDDNLRRTEYAAIFNQLNKGDKKYKLSTANALWAQKDYQFLAEYFDKVEKYYGGKATNLDFKKDPEGSRITINNWVEDQTNDKIKDLIPQGLINELTRLVLTNAVYFKGEWIKQFNEKDTKDEDFRISKNNSIKVPMMQRTDEEAKFNYAENDKLQILEMPYSGEELSMLILLPKNDDLATLENLLSAKKLSEWKKDLKNQRVKIFIPKFKLETKYSMAGDLKAMGMPTAFRPGADFSGMNGAKGLYIGEVIHQAFIEVNEEGTEAAASSAVVFMLGAAPGQKTPKIPIFRVDHPFIFLIQEKSTGIIIFMGRVINPTL
ncbi:MAG: serpin family protein [Microgenomates group bacterium]